MDEASLLIIGANGQLGKALQARYPNAKAVDSKELDITSSEQVASFDWAGIDVLINAAAYTDVDGAESPKGRISAWQVNAVGGANLAKAALEHNLVLVHISTDYVFDGTRKLHDETEPFSPLGVYGQSKAAGDMAVSLAPKHYIIRTSWVIGDGKNFVRIMLGLGAKGIAPTVVADQVGRPSFTVEIVRAINHLITTQAPAGTYNVSNGGEPVNWGDFTRAIFQEAGYSLTVTDTTTAEYFASKPGVAPRPLNSTFDLSKLESTGFTPRDWHDDLKNYVRKEIIQ